MLGKTLLEIEDHTSSDFQVASAYDTQPSFANKCTTTIIKGVHLTN